jgi:hypothetical protein
MAMAMAMAYGNIGYAVISGSERRNAGSPDPARGRLLHLTLHRQIAVVSRFPFFIFGARLLCACTLCHLQQTPGRRDTSRAFGKRTIFDTGQVDFGPIRG